MSATPSIPCDQALLNRYQDDRLETGEQERVAAHLSECEACRKQIELLSFFSQELRRRIETETDAVDFSALEKAVIVKAVRQHRSRGGNPAKAMMKVFIPAAAMAGILLSMAYWQALTPSTNAPSAIIKSFTGPISSVMIFETPTTHQTILWYNEATDEESEQNEG